MLARGIRSINCVWYLRAVCTLDGNEPKSSDRFSISERVRAPASASLRARVDLKDVTNARLSLRKDVRLHERTQYLRQFEITELHRVKLSSLRRHRPAKPVELSESLWENTESTHIQRLFSRQELLDPSFYTWSYALYLTRVSNEHLYRKSVQDGRKRPTPCISSTRCIRKGRLSRATRA